MTNFACVPINITDNKLAIYLSLFCLRFTNGDKGNYSEMAGRNDITGTNYTRQTWLVAYRELR